MGRLSKFKKQIFSRRKESNATTLTCQVTLKCGNSIVNGIACVSNLKMIGVSTSDDSVYIYEKESTTGEAISVFNKHEAVIKGVVHLSYHILASLHADGMLLTWQAGRVAVQVDKLQCSGYRCITKASPTELLIGTSSGEIVVVGHKSGENLSEEKRFQCCDTEIYHISAYDNTFAALTDRNLHIGNYFTRDPVRTFPIKQMRRVAVSQDLIAMGGDDCIIYMHQRYDRYPALKPIDLRIFHDLQSDATWICDISFLSARILMVTTTDTGIFFLEVQSRQCTRWKLECSQSIREATILSDNRVCVGGLNGYCAIFEPPGEVADFIAEYTHRMYSNPVLDLIQRFSPPERATFHGIQNRTVPTADAVGLATDSKFNSRSIEEWAYAHLIVMAAVRDAVVPPSPIYKDDVDFWWNQLYKVASSIEMGKEDSRLVLKFILEAEGAGILVGGCAEYFQKTNKIRSEVNMLTTIMVDLYTRQIVKDDKVREILHYQNAKQAISLVNALLVCIPLAGGVAVKVLTGGVALLGVDGAALAASELVEALLGVGKDWSSFISEAAVKRFLRGASIVLQDGTWNNLPEQNRFAVEAAANVLGLSIEELRAKRLADEAPHTE